MCSYLCKNSFIRRLSSQRLSLSLSLFDHILPIPNAAVLDNKILKWDVKFETFRCIASNLSAICLYTNHNKMVLCEQCSGNLNRILSSVKEIFKMSSSTRVSIFFKTSSTKNNDSKMFIWLGSTSINIINLFINSSKELRLNV